jgi:hypothetical protein
MPFGLPAWRRKKSDVMEISRKKYFTSILPQGSTIIWLTRCFCKVNLFLIYRRTGDGAGMRADLKTADRHPVEGRRILLTATANRTK